MGTKVPGPDPTDDLHVDSRGSLKRFLGWVNEIDWAGQLNGALNTPSSASAASKTVPGVVQLATAAEVIAGTEDTHAVTSAGLLGWSNAMIASAAEVLAGTDAKKRVTPATLASLIASTTEVAAGTDAVKRVTPATLNSRIIQVTMPSSYAFAGNTGATQATYVRLATINAVDGANGANVEVLVAGLGSFGSATRSTALVSVGQYGNAFRANVSWLAGPAAAASFFTKSVSTFVRELWMRVGAYQYPPRVSVLDSYSMTALLDSVGTTDPGNLVVIDNKETDWSIGTGVAAWDPVYFENSIRRIPNGLEIKFGLKKANGGTFVTGDTLINFGSTIKPGVFGNGDQIAIPAYTTSGSGWSVAPANGNITQNGIYYSGSATAIHGLFGTFRINDLGVY